MLHSPNINAIMRYPQKNSKLLEIVRLYNAFEGIVNDTNNNITKDKSPIVSPGIGETYILRIGKKAIIIE